MFDRTMHLATSWVRAKRHLGAASAGLVAAYIAGLRSFEGHRVNNPHAKTDIALSGLSLPDGLSMSPKEVWLRADRFERRKDGDYQMRSRSLPRIASHMRCSLPHALSPEAAERVTVAFATYLTSEFGLGVQYAAHHKRDHPWDHAHFLMTTRSFAATNFGKKVRALDGVATRKREAGTSEEIRYTKRDGSQKTISSTIEHIREKWAGLLSAELGHPVDHRSFERRGLDFQPVPYVSRGQIEFEKRQARKGLHHGDWRAERAVHLSARKDPQVVPTFTPSPVAPFEMLSTTKMRQTAPAVGPDTALLRACTRKRLQGISNSVGRSSSTALMLKQFVETLGGTVPVLEFYASEKLARQIDGGHRLGWPPEQGAAPSTSFVQPITAVKKAKPKAPRDVLAAGTSMVFLQACIQHLKAITASISKTPMSDLALTRLVEPLHGDMPILELYAAGLLRRQVARERVVDEPAKAHNSTKPIIHLSPAVKQDKPGVGRHRRQPQPQLDKRVAVVEAILGQVNQSIKSDLMAACLEPHTAQSIERTNLALQKEIARRQDVAREVTELGVSRARDKKAAAAEAATFRYTFTKSLTRFAEVIETRARQLAEKQDEEFRGWADGARLKLNALDKVSGIEPLVRLAVITQLARSFDDEAVEMRDRHERGSLDANEKWLKAGPSAKPVSLPRPLAPQMVTSGELGIGIYPGLEAVHGARSEVKTSEKTRSPTTSDTAQTVAFIGTDDKLLLDEVADRLMVDHKPTSHAMSVLARLSNETVESFSHRSKQRLASVDEPASPRGWPDLNADIARSKFPELRHMLQQRDGVGIPAAIDGPSSVAMRSRRSRRIVRDLFLPDRD